MRRVAVTLSLLTFALLSLTCRRLPPDCARFFAVPSEQQEAEFQKYSIERQLDIYLCGMTMEPPEMGLACYVADNGKKNVPFLLQRLKAEKRESMQVDILFVFDLIAAQGHLKGSQDVFDQLSAVVSAMKFAPIKERGQNELKEIKKNLD